MKRLTALIISLFLIGAALISVAADMGPIVKSSAAEVSGELPVINISTDSGVSVTEKVYEGASMSVQLTDKYAEYTSPYTEKEGDRILIRCRGNSTYETKPNRLGDSGKYSYKIKLDSKANMLGIGESKHWVLLANYYDVTHMRNKMAYDLSGAMGLAYTGSRWVEVTLNGAYRGIYLLCESIRIEGDRVDITDWEDRAEDVAKAIAEKEGLTKSQRNALEDSMKSDLSWATSGKHRGYTLSNYVDTSEFDITSGYLLEYDMRQNGDTSKFTTDMGVKIQLDSPEALDTNPEMFNYVRSLIDDMEEALTSDSFCTDEGVHYSEFVDMQSLADYFLVFNLFKNIEFGWLSIFLYIEDGTIYFGPCWDFDGSSGNQVTLQSDWMNAESWFHMGGRAEWWKELCGDPLFVTAVQERWFEIRPLVDLYMESLTVWNGYIRDEALENFAFYKAPKNWYLGGKCAGYDEEYRTFYQWMLKRISWLDSRLTIRDPNIEGRGLESSEKISMSLTYKDGSTLSQDTLSVAGVRSDFLYDSSSAKDLTLKVSTLHTSHRKMEIYVNGALITQCALDMNNPAAVTIPASALDTQTGDVNVIYMVGINHENNYYRASYITLRSAEAVPSDNQYVVRVGNDYIIADKGERVTLPEADLHADGFEVLGWTDGARLYPSGTPVSIGSSAYLWIDWERVDTEAELVIDQGRADADPSDKPSADTTTQATTTAPKTEKPTVQTTAPKTEEPTVQTTAPKTEEPTVQTTAPKKEDTDGGDEPAVTSTSTTKSGGDNQPSVTTTAEDDPSLPCDDRDKSENSNTDSLMKVVGVAIVIAAAVTVYNLIRKKKKNE